MFNTNNDDRLIGIRQCTSHLTQHTHIRIECMQLFSMPKCMTLVTSFNFMNENEWTITLERKGEEEA